MIFRLAFYLILGKPLVFYTGILTLLSFLFTALIGWLNYRGNHRIPFRFHPLMALTSITLALFHALLGLSIYFNF